MQYNTTKFTNIDDETFIGIYDGDKYEVESKDERYFPTFISKHFEAQLLEKMFQKASTANNKLKYPEFIKTVNVLDEEMITVSTKSEISIKQSVLVHEQQVKVMLAEKERAERSKVVEAMDIAKEDDR